MANLECVTFVGRTLTDVSDDPLNFHGPSSRDIVDTTLSQSSAAGSPTNNAPTIHTLTSVGSVPLPAGNKRPPRLTTMFTGRRDILQQLVQYFNGSKSSMALKAQKIFVLYGLGGTGKTSIMGKFVDEFSDQFSDVYYVDASTLATLQAGFESIARDASAGQTVDDALQWLAQQRNGWLLMLDGADDPSIDLYRYFPHCLHGNIIITSRNKECCIYAPDSNCCVSNMEPDDAIELLLQYAMVEHSDENRRLCTAIAQELGFLALAVAQAGAFISQSSCLSTYMQIYQKDRAELLRRHLTSAADDYKWTVYTTWEMNLKQLSPVASTFLRICAFMHHEDISGKIFRKASTEKPCDSFQAGSVFLQNFKTEGGRWSEIRFLDCIHELASYSLIHSNGDVYSIHPLIHSWAEGRLSTGEREEGRMWAMQILALSIPLDESSDAHAFRRALLPHVDAAHVGNMTTEIAERFSAVYEECRRWNDAEELLKHVVEARKTELGVDHPTTLYSMDRLVFTYIGQQRWNEAEQLGLEVVEARMRLFGDEDQDTLDSKGNLASTYSGQGRLEDAETLAVQVLEANRKMLGDEHPSTLVSKSNLARTYANQGRLQKAETLEVQALEARRRLLGDDHPHTLYNQANLASIYRGQGRLKEAALLLSQVVESSRRLLGNNHPDTQRFVGLLSDFPKKSNQGHLKKAGVLLSQVFESSRRFLGKNRLDTQRSVDFLSNLSKTSNQGQLQKAETLDRIIIPQDALDHIQKMERYIKEALEPFCINDDSTYLIRVGFNEDMIRAEQGILQEIYVYINFDIRIDDEAQMLDRLSPILSPFPSTVHTPSKSLQIPITGPEGKLSSPSELWALFRSCKILLPETALRKEPKQADVVEKSDSAEGNTRGSGGRSADQDEPKDDAEGSSSGQEATGQDSSRHDLSPSDDNSRDRSIEETRTPSPVNARVISNTSTLFLESGGGGPEFEPHHSGVNQRRRATLRVPLSTVAKIRWDKEPVTFQEFKSTSVFFVTVRDAEDGESTPFLEAQFRILDVGTKAEAESQIRYCLHQTHVRISASRHSTSPKPDVLNWSPCTTQSRGDAVKETRASGKSRSFAINATQSPGLNYTDARSTMSSAEETRNVSTISAGECDIDNPDITTVEWTYDIGDPHEREVGRTFREPPMAKFSFDNFSERPRVRVEQMTLWSSPVDICKDSAKGQQQSRPWSSWSWPPFKNKKRRLPVFHNFLHQSSTSLCLDGLEGDCSIRNARLISSTKEPAPNSDNLQCESIPGDPWPARNSAGNIVLNVEGTFTCALYGHLRNNSMSL